MLRIEYSQSWQFCHVFVVALVLSLAPDEAASVSLMHAMTWLGHDAGVDELLWVAVGSCGQAELVVLWRR